MAKLVAIHGSGGYVPGWREAARSRGCEVVPVHGFSSDVVDTARRCDAFLWHIDHEKTRDLEFARGVLLAVEAAGVRVYPNHATCWHFDDKIAQKYLLEAVQAPLAETWIFFSRPDALAFLSDAQFPLVFKLRRGAGSLNVRLVRDRAEGARLVRRMFGRGMSPFPAGDRLSRAAARGRARLRRKEPVVARGVRVARRIFREASLTPRERGYALFQRYIPGNKNDIRVTVIGDRSFVFLRDVRPNDFRASGSGRIRYAESRDVPGDVVDIASSISRTLGFQSMAYDFVRDQGTGKPLLLEISYSFDAAAVAGCPGHLNADGRWRDGAVWPQEAIIEDLLAERP